MFGRFTYMFQIQATPRIYYRNYDLCCFYFGAVLIVGVPFPTGVKDRIWNSIVSVSDLCLFYFML